MKRRIMLIGCTAGLVGVYLLNTSRLAEPANGRPRIVAQRGVAQNYAVAEMTSEACTARMITPPTHDLIDNTIPSIAAALHDGADIIEIDIRITRDHQFVLFHDNTLNCRTDGTGRAADHNEADLKQLDAGYGYSADGGATFPLRGKGVGLIPTLPAVLGQFPDARFLVQIKDSDSAVAPDLVAVLNAQVDSPWSRLTFFGPPSVLHQLKHLKPNADMWSTRGVHQCVVGYVEFGWLGHVPQACDNAMMIVPIHQAHLFWGWPYRFLARMKEHHTQVMLIGEINNLSTGTFSRLDTVEEFAQVPRGFDGLIWTDSINVIGPLGTASNPTMGK